MGESQHLAVVGLDCFTQSQSVAKQKHKIQNAIQSLQALASAFDWKLKPVAVVSPDQVKWPRDFDGTWGEQMQTLGQEALERLLARARLKHHEEAEVLLQVTHSRKESAKTLATFARRKWADTIVVFSHMIPRSRILGPRIGGFINRLVEVAEMPVVVINAQAQPITKIKTIMVPTDFSPLGAKVLMRAAEMASDCGARLILYHAMGNPLQPEVYAGSPLAGGYEAVSRFFDLEEKRLRKLSESWLRRAHAKGVKPDFVFERSSLPPSAAILRASAKYQADLLVMAERTSPMMAAVVGSVTREVLERSPNPVMVLRSK